MEQDIFAGAGDNFVFIATGTASEGSNGEQAVLILSPEGAEKLAGALPRLAQLARNLKNHPEIDQSDSPVPDGTLNLMASRLVQAGFIWKNGWWGRKGDDYVGQRLAYPQATVKAFARITKIEEKKNDRTATPTD